tara:strand:- start:2272 stop:2559 length:288 start_codon:yes stop_codon:yes gene_type:complete
MAIPVKWNTANFKWINANYTWDEVQLVEELYRTRGEDFDDKKKKRLVKLILKVYGNTITETKRREIKQYKIKTKDIRIVVKEVLGTKMIAENISF